MRKTEVWKHVWGFSRYMVSDMGRVKSRETGLLVVQEMGKDGHYRVVLTNARGQTFIKCVYRIVMETFDWHSGDYSQIYHENNDKSDNRFSNLRRILDVDPREARRKLESAYIALDEEGKEVPVPHRSRVSDISDGTNDSQKPLPKKRNSSVKRPPKNRVRVKVVGRPEVYPSISEMCRALDLDRSQVGKMLRGDSRQKTYSGMTFEYVLDPTVPNTPTSQIEYVRRTKRPSHYGKRIRVVETGKTYDTQAQLVRELGLQQSLVSRVLRGQAKHHGGYTFEYIDDDA